MDRRGFLKRLGIGVTTAVVAPQVLLEKKEEVIKPGAGIVEQIKNKEFVMYTGKLGMKEFEEAIKNFKL